MTLYHPRPRFVTLEPILVVDSIILNFTFSQVSQSVFCIVHISKYNVDFAVKEIMPSVVEPSFGVGRVMYSIFEHNFRMREGDEKRSVSFIIL